jgi:hypothetical protein
MRAKMKKQIVSYIVLVLALVLADAGLLFADGQPDLVITAIGWSPSTPVAGELVTFSYTEENQGNAGTGDFTNALYIDGERKDATFREPLAAGESRDGQSFTYQWSAEEGEHTVTVETDWLKEVPEGDEGNNDFTKAIHSTLCTSDTDCPEGWSCPGSGICTQPCTPYIHCDCPQGWFCYKGTCVRDPKMSVYCCDKPGCPPGEMCIDVNGVKSVCPEDPNYVCLNACDCGPAHCCKDNICVKDVNDPWDPGGTAIGTPCEIGVDPTYCCGEFECFSGRAAYKSAGILDAFHCYNRYTEKAEGFCGRKPCYGTACNCEPGEVCVETAVHFSTCGGYNQEECEEVPYCGWIDYNGYGVCRSETIGKTCFLLGGGACISWATAEALFGWPSSALISCCTPDFTGSTCDVGWQTGIDGRFAYERLVAPLGTCGDGICEEGEFPETCQDCFCGDGICHPQEITTCPNDCGWCGDGTCQEWESPRSCPADCVASSDDGWCEIDEYWSCPLDCSCPDSAYYPGVYAVCGDGYCQNVNSLGPETCQNCPQDCGTCTNAPPPPSQTASEQILFSRLFGGAEGPIVDYFAPDIGRSIMVKEGYVYVTGQTYCIDFPVTDESSHNGNHWDAFVMKLDTNGNTLLSSYLDKGFVGEDKKDTGRAIAVDDSGNIYVTGSMGVVKLNPSGGNIFTNSLWDSEGGYGIAVDAQGYIYVTGSLALGAAKLDPNNGTPPLYHNTELGGVGYDIDVDSNGNAYITGSMGVVKLDPSGSLVYTTDINGTGYGICVKNGSVYVTGQTYSADFPVTTEAFDTSLNAAGDAFVAKLNSYGEVVYATYLGGDSYDIGRGIALDSSGNVYVTGFTYSADFPTTAGAADSSLNGSGDIFITKLNPKGGGSLDLLYSTLLGGSDPAVPSYFMPDRAFGIALDEQCTVHVTGESGSVDFPTTDTNTFHGFTDAFVVKLSIPNHPPEANAGPEQTVPIGPNAMAPVTLDGSGSSDPDGDAMTYRWSIVSKPTESLAELNDPTLVQPSFTADKLGDYVVSLVVSDGCMSSDPSFVTIVVISMQDAAKLALQEAIDTIRGLDDSALRNKHMKNALIKKLNATLEMIDQEAYQGALYQLEYDILPKTNGCAETGSPDKDDWIIDCVSQDEVHTQVMEAITLVRNLITNNPSSLSTTATVSLLPLQVTEMETVMEVVLPQ